MASEIRNKDLWQEGRLKIDWVRHHMPILNSLEEEFRQTLPFKGKKVALSVHLEAKTAYLCEVLAAGGAEMYVTGSNPLSTQDDVAAALVQAGLNVFAWYDATPEEYEAHIRRVLEVGPNIIIDDGGDLVEMLHNKLCLRDMRRKQKHPDDNTALHNTVLDYRCRNLPYHFKDSLLGAQRIVFR